MINDMCTGAYAGARKQRAVITGQQNIYDAIAAINPEPIACQQGLALSCLGQQHELAFAIRCRWLAFT